MSESAKPDFFRGIVDSQSYLNIIYLLLAFPLSIFYFVFLVTGISLGFGLFITLAGIPILVIVLAGSLILCRLERTLAIALLKMDIPTPPRRAISQGLRARAKALLSDRLTWTGTLYLFLKFPISIAAFTIVMTLFAASLGLVFAPAYMWISDPLTWGNWVFDPYPWTWILTVIGIPLFFISLYLLNTMAAGLGSMTRTMVGKV